MNTKLADDKVDELFSEHYNGPIFYEGMTPSPSQLDSFSRDCFRAGYEAASSLAAPKSTKWEKLRSSMEGKLLDAEERVDRLIGMEPISALHAQQIKHDRVAFKARVALLAHLLSSMNELDESEPCEKCKDKPYCTCDF